LDFGWERFPNAEAVNAFGRGLGAARSGDVGAARQESERLGILRQAMLAANQLYWADQAVIQTTVIAAWIATAEGKAEEALQLLRRAAAHEDGTEKNVVTPGPVMPAQELLGKMLLEMAQPTAALQAFETAMQKEPNRFRSLYGAARAAELAGERNKAQTYYSKLMRLAEHSQQERPELQTARVFLGK
jgi:tetratricopeptide (TPR) repeat protein